MSIREHAAAVRGEDSAARRSSGQPGANGRPAYLRRIDELLGS